MDIKIINSVALGKIMVIEHRFLNQNFKVNPTILKPKLNYGLILQPLGFL